MGNFSKLLPNDSMPKWQIALIVSVPVAFGLGYLYYRLNVNNKRIIVRSNASKEEEKSGTSIQGTGSVSENDVELKPVKKAEYLKDKGNVFFKSGKYEEAIKYYTEAIDVCPDQEILQKSTFFQNRAAAYERLNNTEKVIEDCTTALNLNKRYTKAMLRRAKAAEKQNDLDLAIEDLATACIVEAFQNNVTVSELDRIAKTTANRDAEKYIAKYEPKLPSRFFIKTYISTYQHGSALDKLDTNDETTMNLLKKYKDAETRLFAREDIVPICDTLIKECEESGSKLIKIETLLLRATYYILSKQNSKAFDDLTKIIDEDDIDPRLKVNALIKRGTLHQYQGDRTKREEDFQKAIDVDENNPDIYHHLGQIYLILDNPSESVNNFRKAVALDPDFPVTAVQHCYAEYKYASSIQDGKNTYHYLKEFDNILKRFPDNIECITLYAQVLTERQEYAEGEKLFNEAIQREPKHAALLVHKALLLLQWKAEIESAKKLIYKALESDNDCEFAYETMGTIEMQLGYFQKAVDNFNEAIKRFTSAEELYHLFCVRNTAIAQMKAEERVGRLNPMSFMNGS